MARVADSPEVKAAKSLANKLVNRLEKNGRLADGVDTKEVKAELVAVLVKASAVTA